MNRIKTICTLLALSFLWTQCGSNDSIINPNNGPTGYPDSEWLIPLSQVRDGGPGKDGIPSIDDPQFNPISQVSDLEDDDLVVVSKLGNQVYAYPHEIVDWHEIVNHFPGSDNLTMTYCPLTGTAIGWNPMVNGALTEFGVSGLLYNSNLMPYDRKTNSTWSQMRLDCVNGESIRTNIELIHLMETSYSTLKTQFPDALVLSTDTGTNRNYGQYPYGDYRTNTQLIFPIDGEVDNSLHPKERVLGIQANEETIAFTFDQFSGNESVVIEATVGGLEVVVIGNKSQNFLVAFENSMNGATVNLSGIETTGEGIAKDDNENIYNAFGEVISGPSIGSQLKEVTNYIGYWFALAAFDEDIELIN